MYKILIATLALLIAPALTQAHSLAPYKMNVRTIDDMVRVRLTVTNKLDKPANFKVIVYSDIETNTVVEEARVAPAQFSVAPGAERRFTVTTPVLGDHVYVCTRTVPSITDRYASPTEMCSAIIVKYRSTRRKPE